MSEYSARHSSVGLLLGSSCVTVPSLCVQCKCVQMCVLHKTFMSLLLYLFYPLGSINLHL